MTQSIDYVKQKPGDKDRIGTPLIACPKCGKTGLLRHYPKEKFDLVIHKKELQIFFWNVTQSCILKHEEIK
jgi:hypothetical protein